MYEISQFALSDMDNRRTQYPILYGLLLACETARKKEGLAEGKYCDLSRQCTTILTFLST